MRIERIYLDKHQWSMDVCALSSGNGIVGVPISRETARQLISTFGLEANEHGEYEPLEYIDRNGVVQQG